MPRGSHCRSLHAVSHFPSSETEPSHSASHPGDQPQCILPGRPASGETFWNQLSVERTGCFHQGLLAAGPEEGPTALT